ncbi:MAG: sporulation integral membrane protein YtvI [Oscillospiraceae bacterium]|nr:sporulation integral membrane protein YtvI [Oscillospiraceae bacterium]
MDTVSKRRRFLINLLYWAAILAIVYLCFRYLLKLLMPFVIAMLVAWLLRPICRWYRKKNLRGQLYTALVVATVLLFYLIIGGLVILILINVGANIAQRLSGLPALYTQTIEPGLSGLYASAEELVSRIDPRLEAVVNRVMPELISSLGSAVSRFSVTAVTRLTSLATSIPSALLSAAICIISTIFMATTFESIIRFMKKNLPEKVTETTGYVVKSFRNVIMKYGISYLIIMLMTFGEIAVGLLIIGKPRALLIAALIAIFDIFPIVGAGLILLPWTVITFIQGKVLQGIGMAILYVVIIIVRQIMEPRIVGRQVGLPPLITLACMFVGTSLFGGLGLFGLPILAAILTNLNDDPDVPIRLYRRPGSEEGEEETAEEPGKIVYRFAGIRQERAKGSGKKRDKKGEEKP